MCSFFAPEPSMWSKTPVPDKLYCLTMMTPNEGFAELIRNGTLVELSDEDRAVITGRG